MQSQTYGYLPSRRASPPLNRYQIILLGEDVTHDMCSNNLLEVVENGTARTQTRDLLSCKSNALTIRPPGLTTPTEGFISKPFSGLGIAICPVCVTVCMSVYVVNNSMTSDPCWFILTLSRPRLKAKVTGHKFTITTGKTKKCC